jgi:RHS repeat-associated protein
MSYDVLNRLTEVVAPQGTVAYAYDAIGRRTSRTISGGDVTAYTYDRANRLKTVTLQGKTATYNYDAASRLTDRVLPNGMTVTYSYDAADRVTSIAYRKADTTPVETVSYTYDPGGQRIEKALGIGSVQETPFEATYDEANRLTQITLGGELFSLSYDANGNLASKSGPVSGTTAYTWNARNQLSSISGPAGPASFRYDAQGRRIEKTVNGVTTGFLYDGAQAIAELKGSSLDTLYHTGLQIDEVLARYAPLGNKTLLTDALMSVIAQTNDDESVSNFYAYSPYGETVALGADEGNPLKYTGREDDGTGLYYYRARYYDPVLNRFISEDPIATIGGLNFHAYVLGNPTAYTDPTGEIGWIGVIALGGAAYYAGKGGMGLIGSPGICVPAQRRVEYAEAAYDACQRRSARGDGCTCEREWEELRRATDDYRRSCVGGATSSGATTDPGAAKVPGMSTR